MAYTALSAASSGQLINAAWMNTYLRDNINALNGNGVVPTYAIVWIPASDTTKPDNWFACDGSYGVVDLRDRMIIGAGSTYAVHDVGGSATAAQAAHTAHSITAPAHGNHSIAASPAHVLETFNQTFGAGAAWIAPNSGNNATHNAFATSDAASHSSQALTDTHAHTGSPYSILPPYKALTPILKGIPTYSVGTPRTWADGDVPTAAMFNADLRDAFRGLRQRMLWASAVIMWSGSLAALPSGYQLCDGTNGTPDMRDLFNITAGLSYGVLATGGSISLAIPNHSNHVATQADAHGAHSAAADSNHSTFLTNSAAGASIPGISSAHSVTLTGTHGNHSGFAVDAHAAHAATTTIPPYIALGYMQLISPGTYTEPRTWTDGELIDAGRMNTYLRDNESVLYNGQVPIGGIFAWHESIASIPANYAQCEGSGGRVDTRDRFILGAGLSYSVTAAGGATTATPAAHIAHVVTQPNAHSGHGVTQPAAHITGTVNTPVGSGTYYLHAGSTWAHTYTIDDPTIAGQHAHAFTIDSGAAHSAHSAMSLLPPYHALAFIQRVS